MHSNSNTDEIENLDRQKQAVVYPSQFSRRQFFLQNNEKSWQFHRSVNKYYLSVKSTRPQTERSNWFVSDRIPVCLSHNNDYGNL
jgi:hypothetical protein